MGVGSKIPEELLIDGVCLYMGVAILREGGFACPSILVIPFFCASTRGDIKGVYLRKIEDACDFLFRPVSPVKNTNVPGPI